MLFKKLLCYLAGHKYKINKLAKNSYEACCVDCHDTITLTKKDIKSFKALHETV